MARAVQAVAVGFVAHGARQVRAALRVRDEAAVREIYQHGLFTIAGVVEIVRLTGRHFVGADDRLARTARLAGERAPHGDRDRRREDRARGEHRHPQQIAPRRELVGVPVIRKLRPRLERFMRTGILPPVRVVHSIHASSRTPVVAAALASCAEISRSNATTSSFSSLSGSTW